MKTILLALTTLTVLVGCSTPKEKYEDRRAEAREEYREEMKQAQDEYKEEVREEQKEEAEDMIEDSDDVNVDRDSGVIQVDE